MFIYAILPAAAFATSILSAIVGMAGGFILLAILLLFLPVTVAIPIHAVVQLISNGTRTLVFLKHVEWRVWGLFCGPAVVGILFGRALFTWVDPEQLRVLLALFILGTTWMPRPKGKAPWPIGVFAIAGAVAGTLGMLVGAVGPIIAPFFLHTRILKERLIATKAVCQATIHVLKIIAFGTLGFAYDAHLGLILALGVAVIAGTLVGKRILAQVSERLFTRLFKATLTIIGLKLLLGM